VAADHPFDLASRGPDGLAGLAVGAGRHRLVNIADGDCVGIAVTFGRPATATVDADFYSSSLSLISSSSPELQHCSQKQTLISPVQASWSFRSQASQRQPN
jgi:hypothetical protein